MVRLGYEEIKFHINLCVWWKCSEEVAFQAKHHKLDFNFINVDKVSARLDKYISWNDEWMGGVLDTNAMYPDYLESILRLVCSF